MKIAYRDAGTMPYADCWQLQRELFEELLARKRRGAAGCGADKNGRSAGLGDSGGIGNLGGCGNFSGLGDSAGLGNSAGIGNTADPGNAAGPGCPPPPSDDRIGTLLVVEHPPVYTLGKSGRLENLLVPEAELERLGAPLFRIDRGGDITFHGPGQLVGYPILDLERIGLGLRDYIDALEETVIRTVARYGIRAGRIAGASGVWLDEKSAFPRKICAIGVRASRYVTMHGFALNVTTDLDWFRQIHPCGFADRGVTSIARETGSVPPIEEVKELIRTYLSKILNVEIYK